VQVLFERNRPVKWLFTSKEGVVKKKCSNNTNILFIKRRFAELSLSSNQRLRSDEAAQAVVLYADGTAGLIKVTSE
jgi:hypothetical protein